MNLVSASAHVTSRDSFYVLCHRILLPNVKRLCLRKPVFLFVVEAGSQVPVGRVFERVAHGTRDLRDVLERTTGRDGLHLSGRKLRQSLVDSAVLFLVGAHAHHRVQPVHLGVPEVFGAIELSCDLDRLVEPGVVGCQLVLLLLVGVED